MAAASLNPTRDKLLVVARSLPPAAQVIASICELLQDVNTDLDQIAREIRVDAALAAKVIRISNSVIYGGNGSISSVEDAVGRVGFSEVVRLVGTATVTRLVDRELRNYHVGADRLREALLMHALSAEALAEIAGLDRNTAYAGGLLRGIGMMVLDRFTGEQLAPNEMYDPVQFPTYQEWETARFGLSATRVTTMALDDWRFPEELVSAVEEHLDPPTTSDTAERLANLLNLAGGIAVDHGRALPGDAIHWTITDEKLGTLGVDREQFAFAAERANATFDQQRQALY